MASEKETVEGAEKQEEVKDPTEAEEKGGVEGDAGELKAVKGGEEKPSGKSDGDAEVEETEKEKQEEAKEEEGKEEQEDVKEEKDEEEGEEAKEEKNEEEEEEHAKEEKKRRRNVKKGPKGKKTGEAAELPSPRTPGSERPTRERKTVERFMVTETPRVTSAKTVSIEKGQGTQLKDIPNVAFKLSKRKADENLQLLHTILFGKKGKAHTLKKNIGLFSGFVWAENEEKQKAKVKEKLDKCVKEKLVDFCDVLNISVNKAATRKEELSAKLFEFLESPHATTDILLADKENAKKRKSKGSTRKSPSSRKSAKKRKTESDSGKKRKHVASEDDDGKSEPSESEDDEDHAIPEAETEEEENESEEETNEDQSEGKKQKVVKGSTKQSAKKDTGSAGGKSKSVDAKTPKTSDKSAKKSSSGPKKEAAEAESKNKTKAPLTKKQKAEKDTSPPAKTASPSKKKSGKSSKRVSEKDLDGGGSSEKAGKEPSREEMHAVVVNMLKEVDFNTATLSDILRQLGNHFGVDLIHRKAEVKDIITEVIQNMSDNEEDEEAESGDEDEARKDGSDD